MRIGELAAQSEVSTRALRYYEEQDLLDSDRSPSGQRHYSEGAVERVRLIQQLYGAGLGSKAIAGLLPCVHTGIATPEMLTRLTYQRDRLNQQLHDLADTRNRLNAVIATASETLGSEAPRSEHGEEGSCVATDVTTRSRSAQR